MLSFAPISYKISKLQIKIQRAQMMQVDLRVKLENEALQGIKVVKLMNWEIPLQKKLEEAREIEIKALKKFQLYRAITVPGI